MRCLLPVVAVLCLAARPDEGQWLPSQIRAMDWDQLRSRGMELDKDEFWHPERGGVLNAAVQIQGCSAAFVSPQGLLITNHHCGHSAISALSSLKNNHLKEGFVAPSKGRELATDLEVQVVRRIEDVTDRIHAAQARARSPLERYRLTQAEIARLVEEGERDPKTGQKDPRTTCNVASTFEGREYSLYYRTEIADVRLVYAPPVDTAAFGGDVDNWEWPRHSGDFALFRAYVAPDGTPRGYDPENVPFEPDHWLKVSRHGVQPGDLVLIMGYPGETNRYLSSVAVQERQGFYYPKRGDILTQMIEVLRLAVANDERKELELGSMIRSLTNIEKNHVGMVEGLARNAVVDRKIAEEEAFERWVRATDARAEKYGSALADVLELDHRQRTMQEKDLVLESMLGRRTRTLIPLLDKMLRLIDAAEKGDNPASDLLIELASDAVTRDLESIQAPLLAILLEEARNLPEGQRIAGTEVLADSDVPADEMVDELLAESAMLDGQRRVALLKEGIEAIRATEDPLVVLMRGLHAERSDYLVRRHTLEGQRMVVGRSWIEAQQAWRGKRFYPDANRTLRVSIASVTGYQPRDAVAYGPFTSVAGMLEKHTNRPPFRMPLRLREAARRRWLSRFRDSSLGDVPVCFLANGDTTNGNSGSPVINGKGELVGLNFDRVFENVACDYGWNRDRSRNISLDIRFVLWHLESVQPAPHLLRELAAE